MTEKCCDHACKAPLAIPLATGRACARGLKLVSPGAMSRAEKMAAAAEFAEWLYNNVPYDYVEALYARLAIVLNKA